MFSQNTPTRVIRVLIGTMVLAVAMTGLAKSLPDSVWLNLGLSNQSSILSTFEPDSSPSPVNSLNTPIVFTEKTGYLAGEPIDLKASGFLPGETVAITLARSSGEIVQAWNVIAGDTGEAAAAWSIDPADTLGNDFKVTASGVSGTAETSFSRIAVIFPSRFQYEPGEMVEVIGLGFRPRVTHTD